MTQRHVIRPVRPKDPITAKKQNEIIRGVNKLQFVHGLNLQSGNYPRKERFQTFMYAVLLEDLVSGGKALVQERIFNPNTETWSTDGGRYYVYEVGWLTETLATGREIFASWHYPAGIWVLSGAECVDGATATATA